MQRALQQWEPRMLMNPNARQYFCHYHRHTLGKLARSRKKNGRCKQIIVSLGERKKAAEGERAKARKERKETAILWTKDVWKMD